jgi:hypothetical protein
VALVLGEIGRVGPFMLGWFELPGLWQQAK